MHESKMLIHFIKFRVKIEDKNRSENKITLNNKNASDSWLLKLKPM